MYPEDNLELPNNEENLSILGEIEEVEQTTENDDAEPELTGCALLLNYFKPVSYEPSPGQTVTKFVPRGNIVSDFDEAFLANVGADLIEAYNADKDSMSDWNKLVDLGLKLIKQESNSRSDPWEGAANFKSPLLQAAALKFSDRAATELLRKDDLVKIKIYGKKTDEKEEIADRVSDYLNYKIDDEMEEWRDEHERLIYALPYAGTFFKKTFFDPHYGRIVSNIVGYPYFTVDRYCKSLSRLRRFTEEFELSQSEIIERQRSGLWSKVDVCVTNTQGDNEAPNDNYQVFIEQQGFYDLDEDGYEEPYTFVVHEDSGKIVRIIPRFTPDKVIVRLKDNDDGNSAPETTLSAVYADEGADLDDYEVVRIKQTQILTMYGFLNDPEGGLLNLGYCHLLAAYTQALNALTNQVVDSGTLSNLQGGWLAKGFRAKMGDMKVKPGSFNQTGLSAEDLKNGIMPFQFKEPSQTLVTLREMIKGEAMELASSADLKGALSAQAPATTTLALIQDQEQGAGAILLRLYRSMSSEFKKIFYLEAEYSDPSQYAEIVEDPQADFYKDFNIKVSKVCPNANPDFSSKMQRLQLAEAMMSPIAILATVPGQAFNFGPVVHEYYKALGAAFADEVAPQLPPEQLLQQLIAKNPQLQEMITGQQKTAQEMAELQKKSALLEIAIKEKEVEKIAKEINKMDSDIEKNIAAAQESVAKSAKTLEEAESIDNENKTSQYTSALISTGQLSNNNGGNVNA